MKPPTDKAGYKYTGLFPRCEGKEIRKRGKPRVPGE
jgi:hypothetical protein